MPKNTYGCRNDSVNASLLKIGSQGSHDNYFTSQNINLSHATKPHSFFGANVHQSFLTIFHLSAQMAPGILTYF